MSIFQFFSGDAPSERADIDWNAPVRHAEGGTVEECTALGDEYLAELEEHIDISQEPYIFFENRPRRTYQDYDVDDGLTLTEEHRELPDSADPYLSYYDEFDALFPDRYTDTIDTYRLFSDGEGNTLAYVDITDEEIIFAMDFRDSGNKAARYRTLIHEFAHIYSLDRKSTRLNSSHVSISYAVFCLKKNKQNKEHQPSAYLIPPTVP